MKSIQEMTRSELLDERDKENTLFWKKQILAKKQFQIKQKEHNKYVAITSEIGKIKKRIMEIIERYNE